MKSTILEEIDARIRNGETVSLSVDECVDIIGLLAKDKFLWWHVIAQGNNVEIKARHCMTEQHFKQLISHSLTEVTKAAYSRHLILCDECNLRYQKFRAERGLK